MAMENGLRIVNTGGESRKGAVVRTTQWQNSEFSLDQTTTAVMRTGKTSLIQLLFLFEAEQIWPHTIQEMESQRKELGCLLDFWSCDFGVLGGGTQKERDWVKDD